MLNKSRFSNSIKFARQNSSLDMCAAEIGISKATLSRLERRHLPDIETFFLICKWLRVPMEEFFKEDDMCNPCNYKNLIKRK